MRKSQRMILIATFLFTLCGAAFAAETPAHPAAAGVVNINTADAAQLANLPRVGVKVAQRIVDYRREHGPFKTATDLMQVKGFGEKSFERLSPYLTVDGKTTLTSKVQGSKKPRAAKAKSAKSRTTPSTTAASM